MVKTPRHRMMNSVAVAGIVMSAMLVWLAVTEMLSAAPPEVHFHHAGITPPGAIGSQQLLRGGPLPGYFQPVEILAPAGVRVATAVQGGFDEPQTGPLTAGMLIGSVYRLRVIDLPTAPGVEVYPTIEVIDRLYPPLGQERRFAIPVELTNEELLMAVDGKFVQRVIYLEEPHAAEPASQTPGEQPYFEAAVGEDPLDVADRLGRPMAILRIGGRVPDASGPDAAFLYGPPAILKFPPLAQMQPEVVQPPAQAPELITPEVEPTTMRQTGRMLQRSAYQAVPNALPNSQLPAAKPNMAATAAPRAIPSSTTYPTTSATANVRVTYQEPVAPAKPTRPLGKLLRR